MPTAHACIGSIAQRVYLAYGQNGPATATLALPEDIPRRCTARRIIRSSLGKVCKAEAQACGLPMRIPTTHALSGLPLLAAYGSHPQVTLQVVTSGALAHQHRNRCQSSFGWHCMKARLLSKRLCMKLLVPSMWCTSCKSTHCIDSVLECAHCRPPAVFGLEALAMLGEVSSGIRPGESNSVPSHTSGCEKPST